MKIKPWQGLIISILFGLIGIFIIRKTTGDISISHLDIRWLICSIGIIIVWWISDSMSLKVILNAVGKNLGLFQILKIMLSSFFFGAITPFNSGFLPAEFFFLKAANVGLEFSFPVVMFKMLLNGLLRGLLSIVLGIYLRGSLSSVIGKIIFVILLVYGFASIFGYFLLFSKDKYSTKLRGLICKLFDFLGNRYKFLSRICFSISNSFRNSAENIEPLFKNFNWFPKTIFWVMLFWIAQFSLPYFVLKTLGFSVEFLGIFIAQAFFYLIQPYLPTPGGSGIAEIGYDFLTKSFINMSSPAFIFLWRLFSFYVPMIIGAMFVIPQSAQIYNPLKKETLNQ